MSVTTIRVRSSSLPRRRRCNSCVAMPAQQQHSPKAEPSAAATVAGVASSTALQNWPTAPPPLRRPSHAERAPSLATSPIPTTRHPRVGLQEGAADPIALYRNDVGGVILAPEAVKLFCVHFSLRPGGLHLLFRVPPSVVYPQKSFTASGARMTPPTSLR